MLVLDTDLLTFIQRKAGSAYERLNERLETVAELHSIRVTIVSYEEQMRGWLALIKKAKDTERHVLAYERLVDLFDDCQTRRVLRFDAAAAAIFDGLARSRIRIGTMDLKIAAIALSRNAKLLSRNLADFRKVPGLQVEDWTT